MEFFTFAWIGDPAIWASLVTLMALEIVLGIDNLAFVSRLALLAALAWIVTLTQPLITVGRFELSWRDLILLGGGLFLLYKATHEIHNEVEGDAEDQGPARRGT